MSLTEIKYAMLVGAAIVILALYYSLRKRTQTNKEVLFLVGVLVLVVTALSLPVAAIVGDVLAPLRILLFGLSIYGMIAIYCASEGAALYARLTSSSAYWKNALKHEYKKSSFLYSGVGALLVAVYVLYEIVTYTQ